MRRKTPTKEKRVALDDRAYWTWFIKKYLIEMRAPFRRLTAKRCRELLELTPDITNDDKYVQP